MKTSLKAGLNSLMLIAGVLGLPVRAADEARAFKGEWQVLFDGKSTEAFRGYNQDKFPEGWQVEDGTLHVLPGKSHTDLITKEKFEDFELICEWKIAPKGNSGIIYKVEETKGPSYATGYECQILDDESYKVGKTAKTYTGALYDLIAPSPDIKIKPVGEWNESRVLVRGAHGEHWLNGIKLIEYEQGSVEMKEMIAHSKFAKMEKFGTIKVGYIAFQAHGQEVWFRNIRIRRS